MPIDRELEEINSALNRFGWAKYRCSQLQELQQEVMSIANGLGRVRTARSGGCLVEKLSPIKSEQALPRSLSRRFSQGEFPLHTDTAYWPVPARYIVLGCLCEGGAGRVTTLLNWHDLSLSMKEIRLLKTSPFQVVNGKKSFFATILPFDASYFRYDEGCMSGVSYNPDGVKEILDSVGRSDRVTNFKWQSGDILVLDNWKVLHGRGPSSKDDSNRILLRATIV